MHFYVSTATYNRARKSPQSRVCQSWQATRQEVLYWSTSIKATPFIC
jgi:hypothetical protein